MSPCMVVKRALELGLDMIAICDHNSEENVRAVHDAAEGTKLSVIGGMEITSREEVHLIGLFEDDRSLHEVQRVIYDHLSGKNEPDFFGEQLVMDEHDRVLRHNERLLIGATDLSLEEVVQTIHDADGTAIAAHIDRPSFSILSQLGFIPKDLGLDGVEVCADTAPALPQGLAVLSSSDAHRLEEIGARHTCLAVADATYAEMRMALKGTGGRRVAT